MAEEVIQGMKEESTAGKIIRWVICGVGGFAILLAIIMAVYRKFG